jgi:putative Mg2+ transporter-C (MgtC) family protein
MEILWQELTFGFPSSEKLETVIIRLLAAAILGAAIGIERQQAGKAAGVRTHMLVTLATTVLIIAATISELGRDGTSRVIQGIVTGIGFIGAGTIIKLTDEDEVKGLTTSAGIWMACAIGVTVGLGALGLALLAAILALLILTVTRALDTWIDKERGQNAKADQA